MVEDDDRVRSANLAFAEIAGIERKSAAGQKIQSLLPIDPLPRPTEGLREVSSVSVAIRLSECPSVPQLNRVMAKNYVDASFKSSLARPC